MSKIEKIRAEIERRMRELDEQIVDIYDSKAVLRKDELQRLLSFLDTLDEEPDKSLEEAAERFARFYDQGTCDGIAQDCFVAGAEWQKDQFEKNRPELKSHITVDAFPATQFGNEPLAIVTSKEDEK